jgi:ParB/RepB/Spo0J family partition protein
MPKIPLSIIRIGNRVRGGTHEHCISQLMDSIKEVGLQTPITLRRDDWPTGSEFVESYVLIAGRHRLEACHRLGMEAIESMIVELSEVDCKLWEIDENLCRADLSELERGEHLRERKKQYEIKHPNTARGVAQALGANAVMGRTTGTKTDADSATNATDVGAESAVTSYVDDTIKKTGLGETAIKTAIRRAEKIDPGVRDVIRDIRAIADSGVELDALAKATAQEQKAAVKAVNDGKFATVRKALSEAPGVRNRQNQMGVWRQAIILH